MLEKTGLRLWELMDGAADTGTAAQTPAPRDVEIAGLTADSRRVQPGYLFAALPGTQVDGRTFIPQAIEHGAAAILGAPDAAPAVTDPGVAFVADPNPRRRLALMAARFFGRQPATVAAVTGTNGKTSVATFARQLWTALGEKAASMGTIGISAPGYERKGSLTTPDPVALHEDLSMLAGLGVDRLALEASSHGLEQYRLDGVVFAAAAFTNLTRDHLDYHGTMEGYLKAKLRLFGEMLAPGAAAVLNRDSDACPAFAEAATGHGLRVVDYGHKAKDIRLDRATPRPDGLDLAFTAAGRRLPGDERPRRLRPRHRDRR
jgi:UDP-N-acetylmuramoyl-L-alanyl-D-glutamate--2,6-diaminopimelate ligase